MNYSSDRSRNNLAEERLTGDCYHYLEDVGVTQVNVYIFLLALGGIFNIDLNTPESSSVLVIDEAEGKRVHNYFDLLSRNRLAKGASKKTEKPV